jgi:putative spermidine/putrescine transport system ATP-binding protein
MANDQFVRFENVDKSYDGKQLVVKGLNLDIAEGEFRYNAWTLWFW